MAWIIEPKGWYPEIPGRIDGIFFMNQSELKKYREEGTVPSNKCACGNEIGAKDRKCMACKRLSHNKRMRRYRNRS